jgi:flagellar biosynthesis/type III secretory pathway chaperone
MTDQAAHDTEQLAQLPAWVEQLEQLLAAEFESLKQRDVEGLEKLNPAKTDLLEKLSQVATSLQDLVIKPVAWADVQDRLQACSQAHFRNMNLMQRQLDAVRGALQALQGSEASVSVDLYDRMGQMARRSGAWMYQLA